MGNFPLGPIFIGAGLGLAASQLIRERRHRYPSEWLNSFNSWAGPPSSTEDESVARTIRVVSDVLNGSADLAGSNFRIVPQGSSTNNTNVKRTADVDLVVVLEEPWWLPYENESLQFESSGRSAHAEYATFKGKVLSALQSKFGIFAVTTGSKCLKIDDGGTNRVQCDVLPAFRLHQNLPRSSWGDAYSPRYHAGILFFTPNGDRIVSYPEKHLENGRQKNVRTGYRYKQIVRILKKTKSLLADGATILTAIDRPASFEIECAVYNVPDSVITTGNLYEGVVATLKWLVTQTGFGPLSNKLVQVNEIHRLFPVWNSSGATLLGSTPAPAELARFQSFARDALVLITASPSA